MPSVNLIINAAAGSGKTSSIIREALACPERKILITTFTNNNESEIRRKFYDETGFIPSNVTIQTWFTFLLDHFVRPYQKAMFSEARIHGLAFVNQRSVPYIAETNTRSHYFISGLQLDIYSDKIAKFGFHCNERSGGSVMKRLTDLFDHIFVDEVQDLAAWDLDIIDLLFSSPIDITLVGDYRQSTFRTNNAAKHKQYAGTNIVKKFKYWEEKNVCKVRDMNHSYRCNQAICDLADKVFVDAVNTISYNSELTGHDGIFNICHKDVKKYIELYSPQILRYDRKSLCDGNSALNFGESKGLGFSRVLIYPHGPIRQLLSDGDFSKIKEPSKLYVAITRARHSVTFVTNDAVNIDGFQRIEFD